MNNGKAERWTWERVKLQVEEDQDQSQRSTARKCDAQLRLGMMKRAKLQVAKWQ